MDKDNLNSPAKGQSSNTRLAAMVLGAIVLIAVLWVSWDLWNRRQRALDCGDGPRYAIDTRQFATQYSAYSLELEASLNDKQKVSVKLDPVQQQKLSEALESANEFRKYVVSGFNSCGITKSQYAQYGARFQALDSLAHRIDELSEKANRSAEESAGLSALIGQYSELAHKLGTD